MGIFEKLDRQIRNCALGWISGTKKIVTSNLKWFTKNHIISKNVQVKYGSDFLRKNLKMENGFQDAVWYAANILGYLKLVWCSLLVFLGP